MSKMGKRSKVTPFESLMADLEKVRHDVLYGKLNHSRANSVCSAAGRWIAGVNLCLRVQKAQEPVALKLLKG